MAFTLGHVTTIGGPCSFPGETEAREYSTHDGGREEEKDTEITKRQLQSAGTKRSEIVRKIYNYERLIR